jgi:hypothetical protein
MACGPVFAAVPGMPVIVVKNESGATLLHETLLSLNREKVIKISCHFCCFFGNGYFFL